MTKPVLGIFYADNNKYINFVKFREKIKIKFNDCVWSLSDSGKFRKNRNTEKRKLTSKIKHNNPLILHSLNNVQLYAN